jgi:hypothetical protein
LPPPIVSSALGVGRRNASARRAVLRNCIALPDFAVRLWGIYKFRTRVDVWRRKTDVAAALLFLCEIAFRMSEMDVLDAVPAGVSQWPFVVKVEVVEREFVLANSANVVLFDKDNDQLFDSGRRGSLVVGNACFVNVKAPSHGAVK